MNLKQVKKKRITHWIYNKFSAVKSPKQLVKLPGTLLAFSSFNSECCTFLEETKKLQQLSVNRSIFVSAVGAML